VVEINITVITNPTWLQISWSTLS